MDWDELKTVLAITRAHTFSGAATALGLTHTTVGRRLRATEEALGVRLFDRTPDGLFPTPAGQDLAEVAERMEAEVLAAEGRILGRDARLRGPLRVSLVDFLFWTLHGAFQSFLARYPSVELTITATGDQVSLTRREADVVMRLTDAPPPGLVGRKLCDVAFGVYASTDLIAQVGSDTDLGAFPWIGWDERIEGAWLEAWLASNAPGARIVVRIDESAIVRRQAVCAGIGAFFMPCFEGDSLPALRRLGTLQLTRGLWLLTLPELRHASRVRAFLDHMGAAVSSRDRSL